MTVHVLALVKGAIEQLDASTHFAALGGIDVHHAEAVRLGLLEEGIRWGGNGFLYVDLTDRGRAFYVDADLASLPAGRANQWGHAADRALAMLDELGASR